MEARDDLEAALVASWDRDTLGVYADHLLSIGDPRGELIALDLQIDERGISTELSARRTQLMHAWLGDLVPIDNVHRAWVGDSMKYGFVEDVRFDGNDPNALARFASILNSPAGPYLRGVTIESNTTGIEQALVALSRTEHRWLTRLSVRPWSPLPPTVGDDTRAAAFAAMPQLELLELFDHPVFAPFSHPTLHRLRITGLGVYTSLAGEDATFDAVKELDLDLRRTQYDGDFESDEDAEVSGEYDVEEVTFRTLPHVRLPSLRRLDLTRNARSHANMPLEFLRDLPSRAQLTHLKLPRITNAQVFAELVASIADMPALVDVEVSRGNYYRAPDLPRPEIRFVRPEPWPWPPVDSARGEALQISQPGTQYSDPVEIASAVPALEEHYDELRGPARDAWKLWWTFVGGVAGKEPTPFPAAVLALALDACPALTEGGWRELRDELRVRQPLGDAVVRVRRGRT